MGRRTLAELLHAAAGLALALWLTSRFAASYPLGRDEIWWCGAAALATVVAMAVTPVRRALAADRAGRPVRRVEGDDARVYTAVATDRKRR